MPENDQELRRRISTLIQRAQMNFQNGNPFIPRSVRVDSNEIERHWNVRFDSNETMILQRQLNQVLARIYDTKYGIKKARMLVPRTNEVIAGMRSYSWRERTSTGSAKLISNGADDLPSVSQYLREDTAYIKPFGNSFSYDIFQLKAAAMAGQSLSSDLAMAAKEAYESEVDTTLANGLPEAGLLGFVNYPTVDVILAAATGTASSRLWSAKTGDKIVADLESMVTAILTTTLENEAPDTLVLPTARYRTIETTAYTNASGAIIATDSILQTFLKNSRYIKRVESWSALSTADSAGTGPRAICYRYDPNAVSYEEPIPYMSIPPQAVNLSYLINCYGTHGGVVFRLPKSAVYMDSF